MTSKNIRMSIDLPEKDHRKIKALSAVMGVTIKDFVIECIHDRIFSEKKPNKETIAAIEDLDKKRNLHLAENVEELFKDLGI